MAEGKDKRQAPRVQFPCHLRYRVIPVEAGDFQNALVLDVSRTGFSFRSRTYLPKRAGFILELLPPGDKPIRSLGRAVWIRQLAEDGGCDVGGMFVEPTHEARAALARLATGPVEAEPCA
jgi:hypothetical protein